jgi:hypothetical protein
MAPGSRNISAPSSGLKLQTNVDQTANKSELKRVLKNAVFWDVTPYDSSKNGCFGGTYHLHHLGEKNERAMNSFSSNWQLKHTARNRG